MNRPIVGEELDELVLQEYLRRRQATKTAASFLDYVQAVWPWFQIEEVHCLIAEAFEALRAGTITRLMLNLPPRAGKSRMVSILLPTWWIGHNPSDQIIQIGHNKDLAADFGREARNLLALDEYRNIFKTELSKDSRATSSWATTAGGMYKAAGVGSGIAGKGFHLGICVAPDSGVLSLRGKLRADQVVVGDYILGETGFARVNAAARTVGVQAVCINGKLTCTGEHPVFVVGSGYVPAKEISAGKMLLTPRLTTMLFYYAVSSIFRVWSMTWVKVRGLCSRGTTCGR